MVRVFILWLDGKIRRDSSLDCLWKLDLWIVVHETGRPCVGLYLLQVAWSMIVWALLTDYPNSAWPSLAVASVFVILSILIFRNRSVFDSELS